jgi:hypothetical protein
MADTAICQPTIQQRSIGQSDQSLRLRLHIQAIELAQLPVHPLTDLHPYWPHDRIEQLAGYPGRLRRHRVSISQGYVIDGRNHIIAGVLANATLAVDVRDDLTEHQIQDLIFELNPRRRNKPKHRLISLAATYYDIASQTAHAVTLQRAADLFGVSKRSICLYRRQDALGAITDTTTSTRLRYIA